MMAKHKGPFEFIEAIMNLIHAYFLRRPVILMQAANGDVRLVRAEWVRKPTKGQVGLLRTPRDRGLWMVGNYPEGVQK